MVVSTKVKPASTRVVNYAQLNKRGFATVQINRTKRRRPRGMSASSSPNTELLEKVAKQLERTKATGAITTREEIGVCAGIHTSP